MSACVCVWGGMYVCIKSVVMSNTQPVPYIGGDMYVCVDVWVRGCGCDRGGGFSRRVRVCG